jgi:arsenate reductase-like glutaredoxin family protein
MPIQVYWHKMNFATQKVERFFKERRVAFQSVDLKKHRLGRREAELLVRGPGPRNALDLEDVRVTSHPVAYTTNVETIIGYVLENPRFLKSPITRSGNSVVVGYDEERLALLAGAEPKAP